MQGQIKRALDRVESSMRAKETAKEGKNREEGAERAVRAKGKNEEEPVDMKGWLGILKTIQQEILNCVCDTSEGRLISAKGTYICIKAGISGRMHSVILSNMLQATSSAIELPTSTRNP